MRNTLCSSWLDELNKCGEEENEEDADESLHRRQSNKLTLASLLQ